MVCLALKWQFSIVNRDPELLIGFVGGKSPGCQIALIITRLVKDVEPCRPVDKRAKLQSNHDQMIYMRVELGIILERHPNVYIMLCIQDFYLY